MYSDSVSNEHISDTLRDMNALTPHMHQNSDFAELFAAGRRRICSDEKDQKSAAASSALQECGVGDAFPLWMLH